MAMGTERSSKALHNFTMPSELRWGNQKYLRCMKANSGVRIAPSRRFATVDSHSSDQRHRENSIKQRRAVKDGERGRDKDLYADFLNRSRKVGRTPLPSWDGDDGIAAVREKLMLDLQTAADRMKDAIFKDGFEEGEVSGSPPMPPEEAAVPSVEGEIHRPWNLRTRRAACKTPVTRFISSLNGGSAAGFGGNDNDSDTDGKTLMVDALKPNSGFSQMRAAADKSLRLRSSGGGTEATGGKRERSKFAMTLSKTEIEEDFGAMVGHRPARRPKKRARNVQRQLDTLFPGMWLKEVTPDMYKVSEADP